MPNVFPPTANKPSSPQLTIYIHAPGVICFNDQEDLAEAGFMNLMDHTHFFALFEGDRRIASGTINGTEASIGSGGSIEFLDKGTNEDFEKTFELTDLYGPNIVLQQDPEKFAAKITFQNVVFATAANSIVNATPYLLGAGTEMQSLDVGRAVMILSKTPTTQLQLGGQEITLDPAKRYELVDEKEIAECLGYLRERIVCDSVPCLDTVIKTKSLSLPVSEGAKS
jgi:hypothetical protein